MYIEQYEKWGWVSWYDSRRNSGVLSTIQWLWNLIADRTLVLDAAEIQEDEAIGGPPPHEQTKHAHTHKHTHTHTQTLNIPIWLHCHETNHIHCAGDTLMMRGQATLLRQKETPALGNPHYTNPWKSSQILHILQVSQIATVKLHPVGWSLFSKRPSHKRDRLAGFRELPQGYTTSSGTASQLGRQQKIHPVGWSPFKKIEKTSKSSKSLKKLKISQNP